jgi:hypothetical protein
VGPEVVDSILSFLRTLGKFVGEEHVAGLRQLVENVDALGRGQVEPEALLAPVGVLEQDVDVAGDDPDAGSMPARAWRRPVRRARS